MLTWERPDSIFVTGYSVRHARGDGDYTLSNRLPESQTSYRISNAAGNVVYRLGVRAHNDGGDSPWSADGEITRVLPPEAPQNVNATADDLNITVSWDPPATGTPTGYEIEHGPADSIDRTTVRQGAETTSFVHRDNAEGITYHYRVRAYNSAGHGRWSEPVSARRLLAPDAPTAVTANVSGGVIVISWHAPTTGIVDFYDVSNGIKGSSETTTSSVAGTETEFVHQNPQGDTTYTYEIRSRNDAGESEWTDPVQATWVLPPLPPTGVETAILDNDIVVSWTAPTTGAIGGYHVERRRRGLDADWTRNQAAADATSYTHAGPDPGTAYEYRLRTFNDGGVSDWTRTVTGIWYQGAAPPSFLSVQAFGTNTLLVRWGTSKTPGVTGYEIRQRTDGGKWTSQKLNRRLLIVPWSADQSLHEYSVRALIDDVNGDWSPITRAVIDRPAAVTNLKANREGSNGVRLHWPQPSSGQPFKYQVQVDHGNGTFRNDGTVYGYETTFRLTSQPWDSTYRYRVLAQNHVGISGPASNEVSVTIPMEPQEFDEIPTGVDARVIDQTTVRLTWDAPVRRASSVTAYRIYRKEVSDTRIIGSSFRDHVLVRQTSSTASEYTDHTAEPGVLYEYTVSAFREGLTPQFTGLSPHRAYARTW